MKNSLVKLILLAFVALWFAPVFAQSVEVTGMAVIIKKDSAQARDKAVENALRAAVEQVIGTMVDSETLTQNARVIQDRIYTQSAGYVKKYEILTESTDEAANLYQVKIKAQVAKGSLESDLNAMGVLMQRLRMPRVAVMITGPASETATAVVQELLRAKGISVVDPHGVDNPDTFYSWSDHRAATTARQWDAEVLVRGKVEGGTGSPIGKGTSGLRSYQASVSLKALRTDTAQVLGNGSGSASKAAVGPSGLDQAARQAARVAGQQMVRGLIQQWRKEVSGSRMVILTVKGLYSGKEGSFKKKLSEGGRGVQAIYLRSCTRGTCRFEVRISGDATDLWAEIHKLYSRWHRVEATPNALTVQAR